MTSASNPRGNPTPSPIPRVILSDWGKPDLLVGGGAVVVVRGELFVVATDDEERVASVDGCRSGDDGDDAVLNVLGEAAFEVVFDKALKVNWALCEK